MAKVDIMLKRILVIAVLLCIFITWLVFYLQSLSQARQARRELIYMQARRLVAEEQEKRLQDYKRQLEQRRLTQQYNQGQVLEYGSSPR